MSKRHVLQGALALVLVGLVGFGGWWLHLPPATPAAEGPPVSQVERDAVLAALRPGQRERPLVATIGLNDATETTDYLVPVGILRRAGVADVVMLATGPGPVKLFPALTVQPLLENAIGHGVENLAGGGEVVVEGGCADGVVLLRVRNPMPFDNPHGQGEGRGHGIALDNIRERLGLLFGGRAEVRAGREGDEFVVQLRFPETDTAPELMS